MPSFDAWLVIFGLLKPRVAPKSRLQAHSEHLFGEEDPRKSVSRRTACGWFGGGNSNLSGNPAQTLPNRLYRDRRPRVRVQALLRESFPSVTSLGMEAEVTMTAKAPEAEF
ncbi:hypothetical protein TsFJ059_006405 [Trichoderma semiorbis]|uniref:Uncharacterized protein n=1 Tax=Trichoderma semiorbis TaxID=1491008 RepID=A0A9P8H978_9HYPO|nr:hypothetical protein TsFJ059_006405 [Trichoderma semiorbis]